MEEVDGVGNIRRGAGERGTIQAANGGAGHHPTSEVPLSPCGRGGRGEGDHKTFLKKQRAGRPFRFYRPHRY